LVILIKLLVILTIIDIRVESMNFTGAINHVLIELMNARALMHLQVCHCNDPVPQ